MTAIPLRRDFNADGATFFCEQDQGHRAKARRVSRAHGRILTNYMRTEARRRYLYCRRISPTAKSGTKVLR